MCNTKDKINQQTSKRKQKTNKISKRASKGYQNDIKSHRARDEENEKKG